MELGIRTGAAIGNGILTVENEAQISKPPTVDFSKPAASK